MSAVGNYARFITRKGIHHNAMSSQYATDIISWLYKRIKTGSELW